MTFSYLTQRKRETETGEKGERETERRRPERRDRNSHREREIDREETARGREGGREGGWKQKEEWNWEIKRKSETYRHVDIRETDREGHERRETLRTRERV